MKINARFLSLSIVAASLVGASAHAADAPGPADGTALIGLGGQVATAGVSGGMADPVPLFAGANGPAIFVLNVPSLGQGGNGGAMGSTLGSKAMKPAHKGISQSPGRTIEDLNR
ncbi:hypothetical protein [Parvibaculum sp. MBR-TMA-1.3b-4.2]|jgi:hypothetical protein